MKKFLHYIQKIMNIHPDKNQRWILFSLAVSGMLSTYISPTLVKEIIMALPSEWLAFESLVLSLSALVIGMLWKGKIRSGAIRKFAILAMIESLCGFCVGMYLYLFGFKPWFYAITSLIYVSFISVFVGKCAMFFKSKLWIEREREIYDNNSSIVSGIVCIIGYLTAIVAAPSLSVALFIWAIACIIDDIGWVIVYLKNKEELTNLEEINEN